MTIFNPSRSRVFIPSPTFAAPLDESHPTLGVVSHRYVHCGCCCWISSTRSVSGWTCPASHLQRHLAASSCGLASCLPGCSLPQTGGRLPRLSLLFTKRKGRLKFCLLLSSFFRSFLINLVLFCVRRWSIGHRQFEYNHGYFIWVPREGQLEQITLT